MPASIDGVIKFWFEDLGFSDWFAGGPEVDKRIARRFEKTVLQARDTDALDDWATTPRGALALIILLDQFPRNIWRNTADMFSCDAKALGIARRAIAAEFDTELEEDQRPFMYLPFEHSEELPDQEQSVALFEKLGHEMYLDYAIQHRDIIARFGRFPHRNKILGRKSTDSEERFLKLPNSSF